MAEQMSMPAGFGGLMRYKEEYNSKFKISPAGVVGLIIGAIVLVIALNIFFPIAG